VIRVAVAAQALALRAGLRLLLGISETVEVVAEAASLPELEPLLPDIDVLVLAAPRTPDGWAACQRKRPRRRCCCSPTTPRWRAR